MIPGGFCNENELPEEAAVREVFEGTHITAEVKHMVCIRCDRKTWYLLLEMDYIDGVPISDMHENPSLPGQVALFVFFTTHFCDFQLKYRNRIEHILIKVPI